MPLWRRAQKCLINALEDESDGREAFIPLTKEFRMDIARLEIPVSGWTCFKTGIEMLVIWNEMQDATRSRCVKLEAVSQYC
jgi:hypothetical protein